MILIHPKCISDTDTDTDTLPTRCLAITGRTARCAVYNDCIL